MSFNVATMLYDSARESPDQPVLITDDGVVTYRELATRVRALAAGLSDHGLRPGDRVVIQLLNTVTFVETLLATVAAGLIAVPINPLLKTAEIDYVLADSGAAMVVTDSACAPAVVAAICDRAAIVCAVSGPDLYWSDGNVISLASLVPAPSPSVADNAVVAGTMDTLPEDTAVIIYTSGTTGRPKGAELTHFHLYMNSSLTSELGSIGRTDVALAALPLFHVYGLVTVLLGLIRRGGSIVLIERFHATTVLDRMRRHQVTVFHGVPSMFTALLNEVAGDAPVTSLRITFSGGATLPGELIRRWEAAFDGAVLLDGYGLSETASTVTFNRSADQRRMGSVGQPLWGVDVRICDKHDELVPAGAGNIGEVVIGGFDVMKGYYRRPDATAEAIRNGWFYTGDLGYLDDEGYLFIVDRKKDLIIRGGYNVYPREVEEVLYTHPAVLEAAVIGRPDERLGEEIEAVVALAGGRDASAQELIAYCRERLANYKCPRRVVILDALPKGPTGKIEKRQLRALVAQGGLSL